MMMAGGGESVMMVAGGGARVACNNNMHAKFALWMHRCQWFVTFQVAMFDHILTNL